MARESETTSEVGSRQIIRSRFRTVTFELAIYDISCVCRDISLVACHQQQRLASRLATNQQQAQSNIRSLRRCLPVTSRRFQPRFISLTEVWLWLCQLQLWFSNRSQKPVERSWMLVTTVMGNKLITSQTLTLFVLAWLTRVRLIAWHHV